MLVSAQRIMPRPLPSAGFSLVELMVALTVGLVILAGVTNIFSSTVKGNADTLKATRLNQELRAAMDIMTRDITRAGYWSITTGANSAVSSSGVVNLVNNPFTAGVNDLSVTGSCITYAYSLNDDQTVDDTEKFGFQLSNNEILSRTGGNNLSCTPSVTNTWASVTDAKLVKITGLTFTVIRKCTNTTPQPTRNCTFGAADYHAPAANDTTVTVRRVDITLEGELASDPGVKRKLTESVRVRNDLVDRYGDGDDDDTDADDEDATHDANETNNGGDDPDNDNHDEHNDDEDDDHGHDHH